MNFYILVILFQNISYVNVKIIFCSWFYLKFFGALPLVRVKVSCRAIFITKHFQWRFPQPQFCGVDKKIFFFNHLSFSFLFWEPKLQLTRKKSVLSFFLFLSLFFFFGLHNYVCYDDFQLKGELLKIIFVLLRDN